jgi:hypothetical protein
MRGSFQPRQLASFSDAPPVLWAVTGLFGLLLVGWSLLAPLSRAPDEFDHMDLVLQQATGAAYPSYNGRHVSKGVDRVFWVYTPGFLGHWLTVEDAPPRGARETLAEWGGDGPSATPNQIPQHPPLYYKAVSSALRVERKVIPGNAPLEDEWWFLRLVNVLIVLPIPPLAWLATRRLGAGKLAALTAAAIPLAVPQLTHIGGSINNDNLLILLGAILAALLAGVLGGRARIVDAIAIGVVTGLALLTKAFALAFIPWIALVYGYRAWRVRAARKEYTVALLVAGFVVAVVGAWWY